MTFDELIALCKPVDVSGPEPDSIGTLTQDSREVKEGSVFIAVQGIRVDGHAFIENAISNGASVIICEDSFPAGEVAVIEVADTRSLLGPLAQAFEGYPARELTIIGITGTNGKTTVATLVYQLLMNLGDARPSLLGTIAKRIDDEVSGSLLTTSDPIELARDMRRMVDARSTHLVMEVSSHAIDQQRIAGIDFDVAAFTNLSHDHLDYHESLQEYARTKKKLFDGLDAGARAVINQDDDQARYIVLDCPAHIIGFSFKETASSHSCEIISNTSEGLVLDIDGAAFKTSLVGTFNAYNVAEAIFICKALGYDFIGIAEALKLATGAAGRLERVQAGGKEHEPVVLVDYAHTPDALENVLRTLRDLKTEDQKLHVIFGCGGNRDKSKRPKMAKVAEQFADFVTVTSDNPRNEDPEVIIDEIMAGFEGRTEVQQITDRRKAIESVIAEAGAQTMILIAGKGHETYQEIKGERKDFDDRKIAREALGKRNGNAKPEEVV